MTAQIVIWTLFVLGGLILLGFLSRALLDNPRGTVDGGLLWYATRIYSRIFHNLRVEGREHIPRGAHPGPMIVVMNHTAGVDPVLVQAACPFFVRYVMAEDMRLSSYEALWKWSRVIFVDRVKRSAHGTREALRHLAEGGQLGIYPEGGLERPAKHLLPFEPGVGMIIKRTGAPVLPIIIEGTPQVEPAWASLWTPSRSRLRVMAPIDYSNSALSSAEITLDLQQRFAEWTGWPVLDRAPAERRETQERSAPSSRDRSADSLPAA